MALLPWSRAWTRAVLIVAAAYVVRLWYFTPVGVWDYVFIAAGIGMTPAVYLWSRKAGSPAERRNNIWGAPEYSVGSVAVLMGIGLALLEHVAHGLPIPPVAILVALGVWFELKIGAKIIRAVVGK